MTRINCFLLGGGKTAFIRREREREGERGGECADERVLFRTLENIGEREWLISTFSTLGRVCLIDSFRAGIFSTVHDETTTERTVKVSRAGR